MKIGIFSQLSEFFQIVPHAWLTAVIDNFFLARYFALCCICIKANVSIVNVMFDIYRYFCVMAEYTPSIIKFFIHTQKWKY